jgi:hypothetical protein
MNNEDTAGWISKSHAGLSGKPNLVTRFMCVIMVARECEAICHPTNPIAGDPLKARLLLSKPSPPEITSLLFYSIRSSEKISQIQTSRVSRSCKCECSFRFVSQKELQPSGLVARATMPFAPQLEEYHFDHCDL